MNTNQESNLLILTDETFTDEVLRSPVPVLVDFWAPWCGPCRMLGPVIDDLAGAYAGRARVAKLNVDNHPGVAAQHEIRSIPTLILFKDGRVVDRMAGVMPRKALAARLEAQFN